MSKKQTIIRSAIISLSSFALCCCGPFAEHFYYNFAKFSNHSTDSVFIIISAEYPDTLLPVPPFETGNHNVCPPQETINLVTWTDSKRVFKNNHTIQLFVYPISLICDFQVATIKDKRKSFREEHHELRRYEITRKWLKEHEWTVTYPWTDWEF